MNLFYKIFYSLFFFLLNSYFLLSFSQNPDIKRTYHWYFGEKAGLDFSNGSPVADTASQMMLAGNPVTMSDTAGNLLFYSNRYNVWNRNHQIMANGTGLIGNFGTNSFSHALCVPQPGNNNLYYIFYWEYDSTLINLDLVYSIVDMNLNGGLGDVISKRNFLMKNPLEAPGAVLHANGKDVWIVAMKFNSNAFYAFLLTDGGINSTPVISTAGVTCTYLANNLRFSPNGKKLAIANGEGPEILDFDNATGNVSNPFLISNINAEVDGIEFSSDNTKMYYTLAHYNVYTDSIVSANAIYQISITNQDSILDSKFLLDSLRIVDSTGTITNFRYNFIYGIQLASNGKIYATRSSTAKLGAINNPNENEINCNYNDSAVYLMGRNSASGLPYFISSYFSDTAVSISNILAYDDNIISFPNPFNYTTTIILPFTGKINVVIYDMLGKKCETKNQFLNHEERTILRINRSNLLSGIYLLNIQYNNQSYSQKLIITD